MTKISEFAKAKNSVSLASIGEQPFTVERVEQSNYEEGKGENMVSTEGIKIYTKESFDGFKCLHTTRRAIVSQLNDIPSDAFPLDPVKCVSVKAANGGKDYFKLEDA